MLYLDRALVFLTLTLFVLLGCPDPSAEVDDDDTTDDGDDDTGDDDAGDDDTGDDDAGDDDTGDDDAGDDDVGDDDVGDDDVGDDDVGDDDVGDDDVGDDDVGDDDVGDDDVGDDDIGDDDVGDDDVGDDDVGDDDVGDDDVGDDDIGDDDVGDDDVGDDDVGDDDVGDDDVGDDDVGDDDVGDDDVGDDDVGDDDVGDDDTGDDDSGDDDSGDDDSGDDDSGDDDTGNVVDPADVLQRTYFLNLSGGTVTDPVALGTLGFPGIMPADRGTVFMPTAIDGVQGTIDMRVGYGFGKKMQWYQDLTVPTADVVGVWSNPTFDIGPVPILTSELSGIPLYLVDTTFTGDFEPGGLQATQVTVQSLFDTTAVDQLLGLQTGGACALMANLGAPCVICPSGPNQGQVLCLEVTIEDVTCPVLPGLVLVPVP